MNYGVYLLYRGVAALIRRWPVEVVFNIGRFLGAVSYSLAWIHRDLALRNLRIAFGDAKSEDELRALALEHFKLLGANLLCSIKTAALSPEELASRVNVDGLDKLKSALSEKHGVVMLISHMSNWELFAQLTHFLPGAQLGTVYQRLGNLHLDEEVIRMRSRFDVKLFERKEGFNAPARFLRDGGLVGVLIDQHAGDGGVWAPFFNRLASTSPLAATLALRSGAALIPVAIYTDGCARWRVVVSEPIPTNGRDAKSLTAHINQALEQQIRASPADWFWVHNRWKTPKPKFLLADYKRGFAFPDNFDRASLQPFRLLIRSSNWLGDAVMSVPAVQAIKRGRPDARVTVLTPDKLSDFWRAVPEVDDVIAIRTGENVMGIAGRIYRGFEAAIIFPNSIRSALEVFLARIPRRVSYPGKWRRALLNQVLVRKKAKPQPPRHQSWRYAELAEFIGAHLPGELTFNFARPFCTSENKVRIGLCPGADYGPAKRWLPERFAEVARMVSARRECEWVLFGTEKDQALGEQIISHLNGNCDNRIGKTTLAELMHELSTCGLLLNNDTGTMHLAAFLNVPTVSIFGSTSSVLTGPIGARHRVIHHHVECSPCFLRKCPIDFRCMKAIEVDEVVEAVLHALED
jgi:heptosyltransferase II